MEPEKSGENRNEDGTFKPGISGNPAGRPKGSLSITEHVKAALMEVPEGQKLSYLQAFVKKVLAKALVDDDHQTQKMVWNYIDGLPKASVDLGVDKQGIAELTEFFKAMANTKKNDGSGPAGI